MSELLIYPTYFPSVSHYICMVQAGSIVFETEDNFQKQTNRNRMYIYSPNGIQLLNIPIKHIKDQWHQKTKDIRIEYAFGWQKQHFKSLEAAYRSSPFFEYFEDDLMPVFEKKHDFLLDLNLDIFEIINQCIGINLSYKKTQEYFSEAHQNIDARNLVNGKKDTTAIEPYKQVFEEKHGFLNNLSILDLLCNEGKFTLEYLKNQKNPNLVI